SLDDPRTPTVTFGRVNYTGIDDIPGFAAPTADAASDRTTDTYTIDEGQSLTLHASAQAQAVNAKIKSLVWDLNADGFFGDAVATFATAVSVQADSTIAWDTLKTLGIGDGPGTYRLALRATDTDGRITEAFADLVVNNVAPTLTLTAPATGLAGIA